MISLILLTLTSPGCFTSTRHVRDIDFDAAGRVRISTTGGRLVIDAADQVRKWTESEGLQNHDLPGVKPSAFPTPVPLPPSPGTHVVGFVVDGKGLTAALYGDSSLWRWNNKIWQRGPSLPVEVDDPTVLKRQGTDLWLGTRRHGAWRFRSGNWTPFRGADEPEDHNAQAMTDFEGKLWVSTLEDGLQIYDQDRWRTVGPPEISTAAPRDLASFRGELWVRHGDGQIDSWNGKAWTRNRFWTLLPRKQATRIATDGTRLAVGQWGGWSEFDGQAWTHHFPPALAGVPVTAIGFADADLWIGTQGKGLFRFGREVTHFGVVQGIPDDWITVIRTDDKEVTVGTFIGGAASLKEDRFELLPGTAGTAITALGPNLITSGRGVKRNEESNWQSPTEAQCFAFYKGALWIGGRRGIYRP